jgi:hypothetical protein
MLRETHGSTGTLASAAEPVGAANAGDENAPALLKTTPFFYLFDKLNEESDALLPEKPATLEYLTLLGAVMFDEQPMSGGNSTIPSAYTYFGQFVDHDISQTDLPKDTTDSCELAKTDLRPWDRQRVLAVANNKRTAVLELECIYGADSLIDGNYMSLAEVSKSDNPISAKDPFHDLVRSPRDFNKASADRVARIPDKRNDSNLMISQLHVAFLRAHNRIVRDEDCSFEVAQKILRQYYHWVIVHDFLEKRIADPVIVRQVLADPNPLYHPAQDNVSLPLEFTVAAYRFGHSMIRNMYYLNTIYPGEGLLDLFVLRVLSDSSIPNPHSGYDQIPEKRIIGWNFFLTGGKNGVNLNLARKIRTEMADPLKMLLDETDRVVPCEKRLAVQDLKRGYMLSMPTGQAVARELGYTELTPEEIYHHSTPTQQPILHASGFLERTPLWFYILCEAMVQADGNRLGQVGSRIVAEVLIGLVRKSPDSFLKIAGYEPKHLNDDGTFELPDLLGLAGVL